MKQLCTKIKTEYSHDEDPNKKNINKRSNRGKWIVNPQKVSLPLPQEYHMVVSLSWRLLPGIQIKRKTVNITQLSTVHDLQISVLVYSLAIISRFFIGWIMSFTNFCFTGIISDDVNLKKVNLWQHNNILDIYSSHYCRTRLIADSLEELQPLNGDFIHDYLCFCRKSKAYNINREKLKVNMISRPTFTNS